MMRDSRMIQGTTTIAAILASALLAAPAYADSGVVDASASSTATAAATTSEKPVVETTAPSEKPSADTATKPSTATTATPPSTTASTPVCTDSSGSSACAPTTSTPVTTAVPEQPDVKTPPIGQPPIGQPPRVDTPLADAPAGGGQLPFTGPGDMLLAIVLALLAGSAGILFMAGAAGRAQIDGLNPRGMDSPSGFKLAYRELLKQQVG